MYELYQNPKSKQWRIRYRHKNGRIIMATTEGYDRRSKCIEAFRNMPPPGTSSLYDSTRKEMVP